MTEKERYDIFRKRHSVNKEEVLQAIDTTMRLVLEHAEKDPVHSAAYYGTLRRLIDDFKSKIKTTVLMEQLEDGWFYDWGVSYSGAELQLCHCTVYEGYEENSGMAELDQMFSLVLVPTKMLTAEEFASLHQVEVVTVRQWIRRGKIRTARKLGNEWRIPALTDKPGRGYTPAFYVWDEKLYDLPADFEYLNQYKEASVYQDEKKKTVFYVNLYRDNAPGVGRFPDKTIECTAAWREKIELILISQPNVRYLQDYQDNICIDLARVYGSEEDADE